MAPALFTASSTGYGPIAGTLADNSAINATGGTGTINLAVSNYTSGGTGLSRERSGVIGLWHPGPSPIPQPVAGFQSFRIS